MSDTPYTSAIAAIETLWGARWAPVSGVPVLWHFNTDGAAPSRGTTDHWLHLSVEYDDERAVAFGAGRGATERELGGVVAVRVLAGRGIGEETALGLLDSGLAVFRGQRTGPLSFIGAMPLPAPGASEDGAWWVRSGIAAFTYRFRG